MLVTFVAVLHNALTTTLNLHENIKTETTFSSCPI